MQDTLGVTGMTVQQLRYVHEQLANAGHAMHLIWMQVRAHTGSSVNEAADIAIRINDLMSEVWAHLEPITKGGYGASEPKPHQAPHRGF